MFRNVINRSAEYALAGFSPQVDHDETMLPVTVLCKGVGFTNQNSENMGLLSTSKDVVTL